MEFTEDKLKQIQTKVDKVLREEGVRLIARLMITEQGIVPQVTVMPLESPIQTVTKPLIIPK